MKHAMDATGDPSSLELDPSFLKNTVFAIDSILCLSGNLLASLALFAPFTGHFSLSEVFVCPLYFRAKAPIENGWRRAVSAGRRHSLQLQPSLITRIIL